MELPERIHFSQIVMVNTSCNVELTHGTSFLESINSTELWQNNQPKEVLGTFYMSQQEASDTKEKAGTFREKVYEDLIG